MRSSRAHHTTLPSLRQALAWASAAALIGGGVALPAHALYKVVGPDGKVSYTDRPPLGVENKVQALSPGRGSATAVESNLPLELRQLAQRYPVTLYTSKDCAPCDAGRELLRQRGIPFSEKQVITPEDGEALMRLMGSRDLPALSIGSQSVRGLRREEWVSYLDAAGYPQESRLPPGYQNGAATPLTAPKPAALVAPPQERTAPPAEPSVPPRSGFRF